MLQFSINANSSVGNARATVLHLPHGPVHTPVFMPVGTHGTVKGLTQTQLHELNEEIILANTYHMSLEPGTDLLESAGGLHKFMNWTGNLLTDSGGFQMVSLSKLMCVTEDGVEFESPYDGSRLMLTPERSIQMQIQIGSDVMMALDDVVSSKVQCERHAEAASRTLRWLDRCIQAHTNPSKQHLFGIVQGGVDSELRKFCLDGMLQPERKKHLAGYAIGGLSGGEDKNLFWPTVLQCTRSLPKDMPRYCMGVGYPLDLVVCVALGVDMFDCVFPTRTARFGTALVPSGEVKLKSNSCSNQFCVIDENCGCPVCADWRISRCRLHDLYKEPVGSQLITIHNLYYMKNLMNSMRHAIIEDRFENFVNSFLKKQFCTLDNCPKWAIDAFNEVDIRINF